VYGSAQSRNQREGLKILILNDIHLGVQRSGGTTPASREALRSYLFTAFEHAFYDCKEAHVCILGDLFDTFEVEGRDWVQCYLVLQDWLSRSVLSRLTLVAGNHDHSPKALRVSSFEMLCRVLVEQFGGRVQVIRIDHFEHVDSEMKIVVLAHCSNQDIFDAKLAEILATVVTGDRVLLHANYDNHFAVNSDHSLNVSEEQAKAFAAKGATLYFAHEHQARTELGGSVVVFGNQWPSSVSDCLNNDVKYMHTMNGDLVQIQSWLCGDPVNGYQECDWRELGTQAFDRSFIKIVGTASNNEAGDCISAIAKFRAKSAAFVVTNGVRIEGIADNEALPEAFEATKAFDVMDFINSNLDEAQRAAVVKLVEVVR
jgi:metallophosphoesterase superfamily enzyme